MGRVSSISETLGEFTVGRVKHICKAGGILVMPATIPHGKMLEDPSEEHQLIEMLKYGIKIENYEIELSNDWDEMGYAYYLDGKFDEVAVDRVKSNALNLVYKAIRY